MSVMHLLLFLLPFGIIMGESGSKKVNILDGSPYVRLQHGMYLGKTLKSRLGQSYHAFLGIRYAATPKRFERSVLMSDLEEMPVPLLAQSYGSSCPQMSEDGRDFIGKEDCLFANIYIPAREPMDKDGYPVIVFIHPGSFKSGNGGTFSVEYFMDENVIYATFNFRLGVLGFLSTQDEVLPGNFGLRDQVTFLQWIKENIGTFGGNKGRITVGGVETGAASVQYLLLSQASKGLFQGAIVHGGSMLSSFLPNPKSLTKQISDQLECPHQPSRLFADCLKTKRLKDLMRIQRNISEKYFNFSSPFLPSVEKCGRFNSCLESFLTKPPALLLSQRHYKRVPLLIGMNFEASYNTTIENTRHDLHPQLSLEKDNFGLWISSLLDQIPGLEYKENGNYFTQIEKLYFKENYQNNSTLMILNNINNILYEIFVVYGVWKFAMTYASDKPVYPYIIARQGIQSESDGFPYGMEFLTPSLPQRHEFEDDSDQEIFSQRLVHLWATFASHHKPVDIWENKDTWLPLSKSQLNGDKPVTWYTLDKNVNLILDPFAKRMKFWDKMLKSTVDFVG